MRNIDYKYGELLINEYLKRSDDTVQIEAKEKEIRLLCDELISENTVESISKLMFLAFEHSEGSAVMDKNKWGQTVKFALSILKEEKIKEKSLIFKTKNLAQLEYLMGIIRYLNYRIIFAEDSSAKKELEIIYNQFEVSDLAREKFFEATKIL